ncbi:MAG: FG-GAP repeat domain-containing protein, partial [Candidatus Rokuibacteriota bacterium]
MNRIRRWWKTSVLALGAVGLIVARVPVGAHDEPTGFFPHAIAVADLNGDGVPDVAVPAAAQRKLTVLIGDGRGGFAHNQTYPAGIGPSWVAIADFNADGKLDLVTANTGGGSLSLYGGDGR